MEKIWRFLKDEEGTETVEWAILAALLLVVAAASWSVLGGYVKAAIDELAEFLA